MHPVWLRILTNMTYGLKFYSNGMIRHAKICAYLLAVQVNFSANREMQIMQSKEKQNFLWCCSDDNSNCYRKMRVKSLGPLSPMQASVLSLGFSPLNSCLYLFSIIRMLGDF